MSTQPANRNFHAPERDAIDTELDRTWAERVRNGDAAAYESVFRALVRPLVGYVIRFVESKPIAEELVQEIFLTLWQRRASLEITGDSITTYLFTAARNRALAHLRRERVATRWRDREELNAKLGQQPSRGEAGDHLEEAELALAVAKAVDALPPRRREVFRLSRRDGLSYAEIAERLGVSPRTVENQLGHALRTLRVRLRHFLP